MTGPEDLEPIDPADLLPEVEGQDPEGEDPDPADLEEGPADEPRPRH